MFLVMEGADKIFEGAMEALGMESGFHSMWTPPCDFFETQSSYILKAEVPGISLDNIMLEVTGRTLSLGGERKKTIEAQQASYHRMERVSGKFVRTFPLSQEVDEGKISASLKNGLLTVVLPKVPPPEPRKVEISG